MRTDSLTLRGAPAEHLINQLQPNSGVAWFVKNNFKDEINESARGLSLIVC